MAHPQIISVGYQGFEIGPFCRRLKKEGVRMVCDVRRNAISRKRGFSKNKLKEALAKLKIDYVHLPALGIPSEQRQKAKTDRQWQTMLHRYESRLTPDDWELIVRSLHDEREIAVLCFERDPEDCHRTRLLNKILEQFPEIAVKVVKSN